MLKVTGGETLRLRFRAATPDGKVIRPPARATVTIWCDGKLVPLPDDAAVDWDGREWAASMSTEGWKPGSVYRVSAEVDSAGGRGIAYAEVEVSG